MRAERPKTRGDCKGGIRPCPWVSCKFHLYLDVNERTGSVKINYPKVGPEDLDVLPATCALDVADEHEGKGVTLEEAGSFVNLTRERVRQIETRTTVMMQYRMQRAMSSHAINRQEWLSRGECLAILSRGARWPAQAFSELVRRKRIRMHLIDRVAHFHRGDTLYQSRRLESIHHAESRLPFFVKQRTKL